MKRARWRKADRLGLPVLLLSALLMTVVTPAALTYGLAPTAALAADCSTVTPAAAARGATEGDGRNLFARVSSQLGKRGDLLGRALSARTVGGSSLTVALPNESYVAPVDGDVLIYARDGLLASEVRAVSLTTGCDTRLATSSEIVRSAILDPSGTSLYVHRVTRAGRVDAGVIRYDLATGASTLVVPSLKSFADVGIGLVFGTDMRWSADGSHLAVQSCGFASCLTRVLDVASGSIATYDEPGQGAFIALTSDHLVTFADCLGLPCPVLSTELATDVETTLAEEAFGATFVVGTDGQHGTVEIETATGDVEVTQ